MRTPLRSLPALVALLGGAALPSWAGAQNLYVCGDEGRSFVVAGAAGAPGCDRVAAPVDELRLALEQPDLEAIMRRLSEQARRLDRVERYVFGAQARRSVRPSVRPTTDPFDTRDRTRDLGQDIDRALDELSR